MIHYNLDNCPNGISGIYLITFPNGKIYIGLSNNIKRRILEHNTEKRQPVLYHAIQKYGKVFEFDILEIVDADDRELMLEKEEYYIGLYQSNNKNIGYNLTPGGNTYMKLYNPNALFSDADLINIKNLLLNSIQSEADIASIYNCSEAVIQRINTGRTYFQKDWDYPIRKEKISQFGKNNPNFKINQDTLQSIINLLKNSELSMKEIGNKFHIASSTVSAINRGVNQKQQNEIYPLRGVKSKKNYYKLTPSEVDEIILLLKEKKLTMEQIGLLYKCSRDTIGEINQGSSDYYRRDNENYPLRLRSKKN